jgi:hypothetical protein
MNLSERKVFRLLTFLELQSEKLTSTEEKPVADFRSLDDDGAEYLFEVKTRAVIETFRSDLIEKGEASREDYVGRTNVISGKIQHAKDQLSSSPSEKDPFRIIVFVSSEDEPDVEAEQFRSTIYGIVDLLIPGDLGIAKAIPCLYFTFSDFFRYPEIDGAIILTSEWMQLCPNPFGLKQKEFEKSYLHRKYENVGAIINPEKTEQDGEAFIVDCDIDRRDKKKLLAYITKKYDLEMEPIPFEPKHLKYAVRLRTESPSDDMES